MLDPSGACLAALVRIVASRRRHRRGTTGGVMRANQRRTWWCGGGVDSITNCHVNGAGGEMHSRSPVICRARTDNLACVSRRDTIQFQVRRGAMRYLIFVLAVLQLATVSFAGVLYNNTDTTPSGSGLCPISLCVMFDDVLVPDARNPVRSEIAIQQLVFHVIVQSPGETVFDAWYFGLYSRICG